METKLFKEPKQRLKDGRYCSDEQKRIEMSIERCKLLEMQLQMERTKGNCIDRTECATRKEAR